MVKFLSKLILLIVLCLFVSGCGNTDNASSELVFTKDNNGETVDVNLDNDIVIDLESNPSTGYRWLHSNPDGSFIYQDGESIFEEDPGCVGLDGCGGVETLTFRSSKAGSGVISLVYARSLDDEPEARFIIYVNVY
jgi:inhibitor of cysteine peptidase